MTKPLPLPSLSKEDKLQQRAAILTYIKEHPLAAEKKSWWRHGIPYRVLALSSLVVLIVVTVSGVAYAAENSLPGTPLYPIKVSVTEPLRTILKSTPEEKTAWQLQLIDRRLAEARTLIATDNLNQSAEEALLNTLSKRQKEIRETVTQLEINDHNDLADELQIHLQGTIAAENSILTSLSKNTTKNQKITAYIEAMEKISTTPPKQTIATSSNAIIGDQIQTQKIERRKEKLSKDIEMTTKTQDAFNQQATSSELYLRGKESLKQAREKFQQADDAYKKGDLQESEQQYRQAQIETEKAQHIFQTLPLLEKYNTPSLKKNNLNRD